MSFILKSYVELKKSFEVAVSSLMKKYLALKQFENYQKTIELYEDVDSNEIAQLRSSLIEQLPNHRRIQIQFLDQIILLLDQHSNLESEENHSLETKESKIARYDKKRARILTGFMLIVSHEILEESGSGSLFLISLTNALGITPENPLDSKSELAIINATKRFIEELIYKEGSSNKSFLNHHPFNEIKGFDLLKLLKRIIRMRAEAELRALDDDYKTQQLESNQSTQPEVSLFGGLGHFWGWSKSGNNENSPKTSNRL